MTNSLPPFSMEANRYDLKTYMGRVQFYIHLVNPALMFHTKEELETARELLNGFEKGKLDRTVVTDEALWAARQVSDSMVHPQSKEMIPLAFRMAAFVPINIPICAGMLLSAPTMGNTLFWQWANQSYNAGFNYANRNASNEQNNTDILKAYGTATAVSCISAVGMNSAVKTLSKASRKTAQRFVPFLAVASAGAFNALLMRYNELDDGIDVMDESGKVHGISQLAARKSMGEVVMTRIALPVPILLLPPYIIQGMTKMGVMPRSRAGKIVAELSVIATCLLGAFPAAVAIFPQTGEINACALEPSFQELKDDKGIPISKFLYNKGI